MLATMLKKDSLKNISSKDLKISFKISDGKVYTSPFDVNAGDIKLNLSGISGLDKTIDYTMKVMLPENLAIGGVTSLAGTIGGSFSNPKINLDMAAIAKQVATGLADKLLQKAKNPIVKTGAKAIAAKLKTEAEKKAATLRTEAEEKIKNLGK